MQQVDVERSQEFRKCIECFLCQNTCHVVRDHEENKQAFSGPRLLHPGRRAGHAPARRARPTARSSRRPQQGLGYCNITKCCTEVCPEHIKITDNAIIPMKERVVDRRYDPLVARPQDLPAGPARRPTRRPAEPTVHAAPGDGRRGRGAGRLRPRAARRPQPPELDAKGHMNLNEMLSDRSAAASPFGDDITFPVDPKTLNYYHPRTR